MTILEKHNSLKRKYKGNYSFNIFLKHLEPDEFIVVLEYILLEDQQFLRLFFPSLRNIGRSEIIIIDRITYGRPE